MIKMILIGLGAIIGLILTIKLILPSTIYNKWAILNKIRITIFFIIIAIIVVTFSIYKIGINRGLSKNEVLRTLENLEKYEIRSILIYNNSDFTIKNTDTVLIKNVTIISEFARKLENLEIYKPFSPIPVWDINVRISLSKDLLNDIRLEVIKNRDENYYLWIFKETWFGEFNLGSYHCKALGLFIEKMNLEMLVPTNR